MGVKFPKTRKMMLFTMYYQDYFDFHIVWTTITLGTVDNIRKGMKEMKMMSIVFMTDTADPDRGLRTNVLIFITEEPRELRERWRRAGK